MKQTNLQNEEALADGNYNPSIDKEVVDLYNLMAPSDTSPDAPEVIQQYKDQFLAMPTANIYTPVLINPRQCDIGVVRDLITEFRNHVPGIVSQLTPGDVVTWNAEYPAIEADLQECEDAMDALEEHTDRLTSNLPSLSGIAQTAMGLATVLAALANPCAGLGQFFGSLLDQGKQLVQGLRDALQPLVDAVAGAVGPLLTAIKGAISTAMAQVAKITSMIEKEIEAFAKALIGGLRMGLADFIKAINADPCLKAVTGVALTSGAAAILR